MEHKERNEQIRQKILGEIADIEALSHQRVSDSLKADRMYQKAIVMSLINIGELSKSFSGHADLNTLLNTYAHPQAEKVAQLAQDMSRIFE